MSRIEQHRGRPRHETGTKRGRKGHGLGTVFTSAKTATIFSDSTCAAKKNLFSALAPSVSLRAPWVGRLQNEPTILVHQRPSADPPLPRWIYETNPPALKSPSSTVLIDSTTCNRRNINCRFSAPTSGDVLENSCVRP